jgi:ABC-type polysaccharide/polyol phosphate export permease
VKGVQYGYRHIFRIIIAMGWSDFMLKYRGSFLGYLWSFAVPLVKFLVIYHIFRAFASDIPFYPLYLFLGILLWEHFAMVTSACMNMLHDKAVIIKKIVMPHWVLILAVGWTHVIILLTYFVIYFIVSLILGPGIPFAVWYLVLIIVQTTLLSLGVGMFLAAFVLKYRDIQHLWNVLLQILFWLTPIMYAYKPEAPFLQELIKRFSGFGGLSFWGMFDIFIRFQPLSVLLHDARRALLYADITGMPTTIHTSGFTALCACIFLAGLFIFNYRSRYFVEEY